MIDMALKKTTSMPSSPHPIELGIVVGMALMMAFRYAVETLRPLLEAAIALTLTLAGWKPQKKALAASNQGDQRPTSALISENSLTAINWKPNKVKKKLHILDPKHSEAARKT